MSKRAHEKSLTNGDIIDRIAFASEVVEVENGVLDDKIWRHSQGVRQGSATPVSPVQIRVAPCVRNVTKLEKLGFVAFFVVQQNLVLLAFGIFA